MVARAIVPCTQTHTRSHLHPRPLQPPIFGRNHDGPGFSLVFYFALPDNWTPDQVPNRVALELFQRFVHDGVESDGCATRDRLKLIPHVANPEEWASAAPLSRELGTSWIDRQAVCRECLFAHGAGKAGWRTELVPKEPPVPGDVRHTPSRLCGW